MVAAGGAVWSLNSADSVAASLLFYSPLAHPTVMMRRESLVRAGLRYDPSFPRAQDHIR